METFIIDKLIMIGNLMGGELLSCLFLVICYAAILLLWKLHGLNGLYLYNIIAVVVANIQVLKTTSFFLAPEPVALGTLLFASTFLVSDIITEHHGVEPAQKGVMLSFLAQVMITLFMVITLAYPDNTKEVDPNAVSTQAAMYTLFAPSIRLLIASLTAYFFSQWLDIKIFKMLKDYTKKKFLWVRLNIATLISGLVDNILFSLLAWVVLSPNPVSLNTLIFTYILGTYGTRVVVSVFSTPIIYLTYKFQPEAKNAF
jgi:uncharacterized integral membrane protein (TIGR00697 family)